MSARHILVVEDQRSVAGALRMRLKGLGHDVLGIASDGAEAVAKAQELRPDLILMDIKLGEGMDGIDAALQIRSEMDIPVIYVSAYADAELLERARRTRPAGFINKPFTTKDLLTAIDLAFPEDQSTLPSPVSRANATLRNDKDAVLTTDLDGTVSFLSAHAEEVTGWRRDEIIGAPLVNLLEFFYGIEAEFAIQIVNDLLAGGPEFQLPIRHQTGHQGAATAADVISPLRDSQGNCFGLALRISQATVDETVSELLRQRDALAHALNVQPNGIIIIDASMQVVRMNQRAHEIVSANRSLDFSGGKLIAVDDSVKTQIQRFFDTQRANDSNPANGFVHRLAAVAESPAIDMIVAVVPSGRFAGHSKALAVLHLFESEGYRTLSAPTLQRLYGFTKTEARLVQSLAMGFSLDATAERLEITVNTARTHLKHVFHKSGAKRQSELIHIIESGPASLQVNIEEID
ncbi:MAG: response regulator [Pseudomonadota bacterium]